MIYEVRKESNFENNLRSRPKKLYVYKRPGVPKANAHIQCDLSEEENCELSKELPFALSYGDLFRSRGEVNFSGLQPEPSQRRSTAYSSPDQGNLTQREPIDISIEPNRSLVENDNPRRQPEVSLEEFQPCSYSSPSRSRDPYPPLTAPQAEDSYDSDDDSEESEDPESFSPGRQFPVINSPADIYSLIRSRVNYEEFGDSEKEENEENEENKEDCSKQEETEEGYRKREENEDSHSKREEDGDISMEAELLRALQQQVAHLQTQLQAQQQQTTSALERTPIPESSSSQRPPRFHGYDSEDVSRWLDKIESYLRLRRIDPASSTALAELSLNLAGPAEDYFYSLPQDRKATFKQLRDALQERFSNDNQSWLIWQAVTTRQQGPLEPLDTYLTDLTNKFRRLNITDAEKMRYFVQGLRTEVRKTVLLKQPKTFREAEEMARLACSVENTMSCAPLGNVTTQLNNLSQTVSALVASGTNQPTIHPSNSENKMMSIIEQNNAILAELSGKLNQAEASTTRVSLAAPLSSMNTSPAVAALGDSYSGSTGNTGAMRCEIRQLKDMMEKMGREMDARIRGLARRSPVPRVEQPRERTRDGRPVCFSCGRTGHLQTSCPDRRNSIQRQQLPHPSYSSNANYNQPRDSYRNIPPQAIRDQRLAVFDGDLYEEMVAPPEHRSGSQAYNWPHEESRLVREERQNVHIPSANAISLSLQQENGFPRS